MNPRLAPNAETSLKQRIRNPELPPPHASEPAFQRLSLSPPVSPPSTKIVEQRRAANDKKETLRREMEAAKPTKINKVSKNMVSFQKSIGQRTAEREKARKDKLEKMRKEKEEREMAHSFKPSFATKKDRKKKGPVSSPSSNSGRGAPPSPSKSTLPPEFESRQAKHLEEAAKKRAERAAAQRKKDEAETASFFKPAIDPRSKKMVSQARKKAAAAGGGGVGCNDVGERLTLAGHKYTAKHEMAKKDKEAAARALASPTINELSNRMGGGRPETNVVERLYNKVSATSAKRGVEEETKFVWPAFKAGKAEES